MGTPVLLLLTFPNCKRPHPSPPLFSVCLIDKRAGPAPPEGSGTPTNPPSPGLCLQEGAEQECLENGIPIRGTQETTQNVGNLSSAEGQRGFPISLRPCAFPTPHHTGIIENTEYTQHRHHVCEREWQTPSLGGEGSPNSLWLCLISPGHKIT